MITPITHELISDGGRQFVNTLSNRAEEMFENNRLEYHNFLFSNYGNLITLARHVRTITTEYIKSFIESKQK